MTGDERRALEALRFDFTQVPDDVWRSSPYHVDALHSEVMRNVSGGVRDASRSPDASPTGVAILGMRGTGKTHLLGLVRQHTQAGGGYFFLVNPYDGVHFWESVAQAMIEGLTRDTDECERQLSVFFRRLSTRAGVLGGVRAAALGEAPLTPRDVTSWVGALRRLDPQLGLATQDTLRALVLYGSPDFEQQDIGHQYLLSADGEPADRSTWGIRGGPKPPQLIVRDISRLLALTGPTVIAVDQIDALVSQAVRSSPEASDDGYGGVRSGLLLLEQIAGGLMALKDVTRRTLTVVACLPESWQLIRDKAVDTVTDRFREALQLYRIPDAGVGRAIVERRFEGRFKEIGFEPPYPTWPVQPVAFAEAPQFTARSLLQRVDAHVQGCLRRGDIRELDQLLRPHEAVDVPAGPAAGELAALDARFEELRSGADVADAHDAVHEDRVMPGLLSAGLAAWIVEQGEAGAPLSQDPPPGRKPALHARLRRTVDEATEDEVHWAFRAIASGSARAVQCRIRNACTASGIRQGPARRRLVLLRRNPWPRGPVTRDVVAEFTGAGGIAIPVTDDDLRTFAALQQLLDDPQRDPTLPVWLATRRPASATALLRTVLATAAPAVVPAPADDTAPPPADQARAVGVAPVVPRQRDPVSESTDGFDGATDDQGSISVGLGSEGDRPIRLKLESLRKHVAIFAGSGSGKTVLIRRLIEECARRGVSTIVLDPNNDLARLGDPWPEPPSGWDSGDAAGAEDYLANTDVVVWTPRWESGRPLSFHPLPDFASVKDDPDEFRLAVDAAVASLAPRARVDGGTAAAARGQAVLREALLHFANNGGGGLKAFVDLLGDLPDGVSALSTAGKVGAQLAETLRAAMVNDPMFGGEGIAFDPGLLLTPPAGKRARVSVVSLIGLPADDQKQGFVSQLQLALFAWAKRHPATGRPLGGLLVVDEAQMFASSGAATPSAESTILLASQIRKYGIGLVFATQAPKAVHHRVSGNAATQFFGFLNSPAQIEAAKDMARAKGSTVVDISRLDTGEFYVAGPGLPFQKMRARLCLSYHPSSPLTTEEVVARARSAAEARS